MTNDMKYPEEIRQDEMLRNLERLQAKLRRREGKSRKVKEGDIKTEREEDQE